MVVSVSLIRSGYEYGTVPDRRGTIHTESDHLVNSVSRMRLHPESVVAMNHAVNCPNFRRSGHSKGSYIFMVEHPIPALLVFIMIWLHFFYRKV